MPQRRGFEQHPWGMPTAELGGMQALRSSGVRSQQHGSWESLFQPSVGIPQSGPRFRPGPGPPPQGLLGPRALLEGPGGHRAALKEGPKQPTAGLLRRWPQRGKRDYRGAQKVEIMLKLTCKSTARGCG